jgi:iron complex transport system substrate-binding protein
MKDAKANYLWADVEGTGSLSLSFEKYWKNQNCQILVCGSLRI